MLTDRISQKKRSAVCLCVILLIAPVPIFVFRMGAKVSVLTASFHIPCGPSRSLPVGEVLEQAGLFTVDGHKEIVVTGIHVGLYGKDLSEGTDRFS